jgi:hypothetical protein
MHTFCKNGWYSTRRVKEILEGKPGGRGKKEEVNVNCCC